MRNFKAFKKRFLPCRNEHAEMINTSILSCLLCIISAALTKGSHQTTTGTSSIISLSAITQKSRDPWCHWAPEGPNERRIWHDKMDLIWEQLKMNCSKWALTLIRLDANDFIRLVPHSARASSWRTSLADMLSKPEEARRTAACRGLNMIHL